MVMRRGILGFKKTAEDVWLLERFEYIPLARHPVGDIHISATMKFPNMADAKET
jgi:hypothetical protein